MFPHKYTSPEYGAQMLEWLDAMKEWTKTHPLHWPICPSRPSFTHPHQNDPRVLRELIACDRYYTDLWFATHAI